MKIRLLTLLFVSYMVISCSSGDDNINTHSDPTIEIENQQEVLEVYPLDTINLNVKATTTSDEPISSFTSYNDCGEKLSSDPNSVYENQYTYAYKAVTPYEKGDTEIRFTAYTDKGENSDIIQKIKVIDNPYLIEFDSSDVPLAAQDLSTFNVSGLLKSKIPFNDINFSTSVEEGNVQTVKDNNLIALPHSQKQGFTITNQSYTKDNNGYYQYTFDVTYTVTAEVNDGDQNTPPTILDKFYFSIYYNFYYPNQNIKCSSSKRFGTWSKTVSIQ
ncbi:hypothetical protein [Flammeovirga kamogawensis]|uniref:DUF4377 domain-containing protein n=1 Tax=Flammeovirga kamogawensis TaxID=373891 RepID=A0ABX8GR89_9BACT|nr:hypothetical protein [Flammeovirga kamogawensis]MBB6462677.1 hypothetical protein [Flammeovirga kamogawensis]QWG06085.1 hypothetical protein KM029_12010 [Flammeovirga kamogawensis]TRX67918.1 hypothetical protein EO216_07035 [Flammeovirga kamogawensis]